MGYRRLDLVVCRMTMTPDVKTRLEHRAACDAGRRVRFVPGVPEIRLQGVIADTQSLTSPTFVVT